MKPNGLFFKSIAKSLLLLLLFAGLWSCGGGGGGGGEGSANNDRPQNTAPVITTQPVDRTVTEGQTATFTVIAGGTAPLSYQWYRSGVTINDATSSTYSIFVTKNVDNGATFHVVATNAAGSATSESAILTVNEYTGGDYLPGDVMADWEGGSSYYAGWSNGPSTDTNFFPIAVWLQGPDNSASATIYKNIGVNTHIGLWDGPTAAQLSAVTALATTTICNQNAVGLTSPNRGVIKAWMHQDEPDNAQVVNGLQTQDPVPTATIISGYQAMVAADSTRPVYLNLGQGVACDAWYGRGNRTNHPEDYIQYAMGADILSFDTYPMNVYPLPDSAEPWFRAFNNVVAQNIWYVAAGVDRLRGWTNYQKPVWVWIECTNFNGDSRYALTPTHVKAEVWMAIIHGARGIGYFCHVFSPTFIEAGLLADTTMTNAVHVINDRILSLASVLNTQSVANGVTITPGNPAIPVDAMVKRAGGFTYVFTVAMRPGNVNASFTLRDFTGSATVEVIGEGRNIAATGGVFSDAFAADYAVHIYKIANP